MHELAWGWCEPLQDKVTAFAESHKRNAYYIFSEAMCSWEGLTTKQMPRLYKSNSQVAWAGLLLMLFFRLQFCLLILQLRFHGCNLLNYAVWLWGEWMPTSIENDATLIIVSHFVHHYLHWILVHMTELLELENPPVWNVLGELVVLILKPLQLLRSSLAFGFRIKWLKLPLTWSQPCRVKQCVASFPSGWQCHDCSAPLFS